MDKLASIFSDLDTFMHKLEENNKECIEDLAMLKQNNLILISNVNDLALAVKELQSRVDSMRARDMPLGGVDKLLGGY